MRAVLLIIVLALVSFALFVGISLGIGWVLALILPFSLFEGTIVAMIAAVATLVIWRNIFVTLSAPWFSGETAEEQEGIPESRFWRHRGERTWENWFRYVFANAVHEELIDSLEWAEDTSERGVQDLSVHLADAAVEGLKGKPAHTKRVRVSRGLLKHELDKMGERAYPDKVMETAARAVNLELTYWEDEVGEVVRKQLWNEPAETDS